MKDGLSFNVLTKYVKEIFLECSWHDARSNIWWKSLSSVSWLGGIMFVYWIISIVPFLLSKFVLCHSYYLCDCLVIFFPFSPVVSRINMGCHVLVQKLEWALVYTDFKYSFHFQNIVVLLLFSFIFIHYAVVVAIFPCFYGRRASMLLKNR